MYKDKDRQREANRQAQTRFKANLKAESIGFEEKKDGTLHIPLGITSQGITEKVLPERIEGEQYYHQVHCNAPSHVKQFAKSVSCSCRKRGKDIKSFEDLPLDVQETIIRMTTDRNGKMDQIARAKRTAIAIEYQHQHQVYEKNYHSAGVG